MKINRFARGVTITFGALLTILLVGIIVTPYFLKSEHIRSQATEILSDWVGGEVKIRGPIQINYFLGATLTAKKIEVKDFRNDSPFNTLSVKNVSININWSSLLRGKIKINKLTLINPQIELKQEISPVKIVSSGKFKNESLTRFINKAAIKKLAIRGGSLKFYSKNKTHNLSDIQAYFRFSKRIRRMSGDTGFSYRNIFHKVKFSTAKLASGTDYTLRYSFSNPHIQTEFNGKLSSSGPTTLNGSQQISINSLPELAAWSGFPASKKSHVQTLHLSGDITLNTEKLTLTNAHFKVDENRASGSLNVGLKKKVVIDGTIAIDRLMLTQYFKKTSGTQDKKSASELPFHLLKEFDADLRISISKITAPGFVSENNAVIISVIKNKMNVDVADMTVCNGTAQGNLELQPGTPTQISLEGHFQDISMLQCLKGLFNNDVMRGKASAHIKLTASGNQWSTIAETLAGKGSIKMISGGQVNMDLPYIFANMKEQPVKGWKNLTVGSTRFDNLNISSDMHNGTLSVKTVMQSTDKSKFSGHGMIYIPKHSLNYLVVMSNNPNSRTLHVKGSWSSPEIAINKRGK